MKSGPRFQAVQKPIGRLCLVIALMLCVPLPASSRGDFNRDGWVDMDDLLILAEFWLSINPLECPDNGGQPCYVALDDFAAVSENWQTLYCSPIAATASSQENDSLSAQNVVDGTLATRWASAFADNQWLSLDMGQIRTVTGLQIFWEDAYASQYNIETSIDQNAWTCVYTRDNATGNFDDISFSPTMARFIRINCVRRATQWGSSIYEVFVKTNDDCLAAGDWELVWSDEFEGTQLNTDNWEPMIGTGSTAPFNYGLWGWGNGEHQYYTARPQNLYVQEGCLHIVARPENYGGRQYTSARIRSAGKRDFMYGRLEARIKLPAGGGMWSAFWMMPTGNTYGEPYSSWPGHGEIDIMEASNIPDRISGALHYGGNYPDEHGSTSRTYSPGGIDFSNDFHVFTLEWTPTRMRWYVDGVQFHTFTNWWSTRGDYPAPFDQRFHFLLNVAVGGYYPGCAMPDTSCITAAFPQTMIVDYVRVYRKNE